MKDSLNSFLEMMGYIIGVVVFISGICWALIRGKIVQDVHKIWTDRMKDYEDAKEEGREQRRIWILEKIEDINVIIKEKESEGKSDRLEIISILKEIKIELNNSSKIQTMHEMRLNSLEKNK